METETEAQRQRQLDFRLAKEEERSGQTRLLEIRANEHRRQLEDQSHRQQVQHEKQWREQELKAMEERQKVSVCSQGTY